MTDTVTTSSPTTTEDSATTTVPTPSDTGTSTTKLASTTKRKTSLIPRSMAQKIATGRIASAKLKERKWTSEQMTTDDFDNAINNADEVVKSKSKNKTSLTPNRLLGSQLKKKANQGISGLKNLLTHKYSRNIAKNYFGNYGIEKINKKYILPQKIVEMIVAIDKLIIELAKGDIVSDIYDVAFWTNIRNGLQEQLDNSTTGKGSISQDAAKIAGLKNTLDDYLNIIINLIYVHVPKDQVAATLREFGFQKERYTA